MNPYLDDTAAPDTSSANPYLSDNPYLGSSDPGAVSGTANEFRRGLLAGQQRIIADELEAAQKAPTMRQRRRAYVSAMSDPRYTYSLTAAAGDPNKEREVDQLLGPEARARRLEEALTQNRELLASDIAKLEEEQRALPQSEAMSEWGQANNSNWWQVLAKNPVEITAGIMAQSLPAMAPALAGTMVAPGGRAARVATAGMGSYAVESSAAYLDAAREAGYDFTTPGKVLEFFENPAAQATARDHAVKRGVPIAVFDGLTMGLAGKFLAPALRGGASQLVARTGAEVGQQAAGGMSGEAVAQLASGQALSVKDIVAEGLGEVASTPVEVLSNLRNVARPKAMEVLPGRPESDELPGGPLEPTSPAPAPVSAAPVDPIAQQFPDNVREVQAPIEAAAPPVAAAVPQQQTVPEAPATIAAQMEMLETGRRSIVLIPAGTDMPAVPLGMETHTVPGREDLGVFIYSPRVRGPRQINSLVEKNLLGNLLGYGIPAKPVAGTEVGVVTLRSPEGVEKQAVVTDAEHLPAVVAAAAKVGEPSDTVQIEPAEAVLSKRVEEGDASSSAPQMELTRSLAELSSKWAAKGVRLDLSLNNGVVSLDFIGVPEDQRNKGTGSQVLSDLKTLVDVSETPVELILMSSVRMAGGDRVEDLGSRLRSFYTRNGFEAVSRGVDRYGRERAPKYVYTPAKRGPMDTEQLDPVKAHSGQPAADTPPGRRRKRAAREPMGDRPPDILDWISDNFRSGVKLDSAADFGDYVREYEDVLKSLKPKQRLPLLTRGRNKFLSLQQGEAADRVIREMHDQGMYRRIETSDQLADAILRAIAARQAPQAESGPIVPDSEVANPPPEDLSEYLQEPAPEEEFTDLLDRAALHFYGKRYSELQRWQQEEVTQSTEGGTIPRREQSGDTAGRERDPEGKPLEQQPNPPEPAGSVSPAAASPAATRLTELRAERERLSKQLKAVGGQGTDLGKSIVQQMRYTDGQIDLLRDYVDDWLSQAIEATNLKRDKTLEGVSGAPIWVTQAALNGVLRVVRAAYRGTKSLAQAIQTGLEWLRSQNLRGYNETEAKAWLERNLSSRAEDEDLNFREFIDQMDADQPIGADVGRQVANLLYERRTNETDAAFANRIITTVGGPAAAVEVFTDATNGLPGAVRMFLGQQIIKALGTAGQHEAAARFYDETFAAHVTDVAQSLQSLSAWLALTPEGKLVWAQRKFTRAAEDLIAPVRPQLEQAKTELDKANAEGIEAATADPHVQATARNAIDAALQQQAQTPNTELQEAIRKAVLDQLVAAGLITEREAQITLLHLDSAGGTLADKLGSAGLTDPVKRAKAILDAYKARTQSERGKVAKRAKQIREQGGAGDPIDAAISRALREMRVKLGTVIRQHHTKVDATGRTLLEKLTTEAGVTGEAAERLARAIELRFRALVIARKQAALDRLLRPVRRSGLAKPSLPQKLIELSNMGALSGEQYWNAVRKQLNLPVWTPEIADRVRRQVEAIERIPEDRVEQKQKAQIEMLNTIERGKGIDSFDLALAFYITNILTGLTTHVKNFGSTFLNVTSTLSIEAGRAVAAGNLSDLPLMLEALGRGFSRGTTAAGDVLRTGVVTGSRLTKLEPGRALELTRFGQAGGVPVGGRITRAVLESRAAAILNLWKYNFRLMAAEDLLFFKPAEEAKAIILAKRMARSEGLRGEAAKDRARQIMGYGKLQVDTAQAQAEAEGLTGSAMKRRAAEILNNLRPETLREDARRYALRSTFNNDPYGALGFVAQLINQAKVSSNRKIRVGANLVAPFTNIIANVVNESLNYTPLGAVRAYMAKENLVGQKVGTLSVAQQAELKQELYAKALAGTVSLVAIALLTARDLEDEDPEVAIYGAGPAADADRRGLQAKGWIPHSVKIGDRYLSFATTPAAIPLAWLGNINDRIRDARLYKNRSAQRTADSLPIMAAVAAKSAAHVITEQTFMSGIMNWLDVISERHPEVGGRNLLKIGVQTASSFVVPNAVRQLDRFFDPKIYEQRTFEAMLVNATPFVRGQLGQPMLNALGLPVENSPSKQFANSQAGADPMVKFLAESGNWPTMPDRNHIWPRSGRSMTDSEFYDYVQGSGELARRWLREVIHSRAWNGYDAQTRSEVVSDTISTARQDWRVRHGF